MTDRCFNIAGHRRHHIDVGTLPLAIGRWDDSGRFLSYIEEVAPMTDKQWEFLHERAKACTLVWHGDPQAKHAFPGLSLVIDTRQQKKCMFEHVPCP